MQEGLVVDERMVIFADFLASSCWVQEFCGFIHNKMKIENVLRHNHHHYNKCLHIPPIPYRSAPVVAPHLQEIPYQLILQFFILLRFTASSRVWQP
jgi:hypothetical protein